MDLLQAPRWRPRTVSPEHMSSLDRAYEALHRQFLHELEKRPHLARKVADASLENNDAVSLVLKLMRAMNSSDDVESTTPQFVLLVLWRVFATHGVCWKRVDEPFFDPVLFEAASFINTDEGMNMFVRIHDNKTFLDFVEEVTFRAQDVDGMNEDEQTELRNNIRKSMCEGLHGAELDGSSVQGFNYPKSGTVFHCLHYEIRNGRTPTSRVANETINMLLSKTGHEVRPDVDLSACDASLPIRCDTTPDALASNSKVFNQALRRFATMYQKSGQFRETLRDIICHTKSESHYLSEPLLCANEWLENHNFSMIDCVFGIFKMMHYARDSRQSVDRIIVAWMSSMIVFAEEAMLSTSVVGGDSVFQRKNAWNWFLLSLPRMGSYSIEILPHELLVDEILLKKAVARWQEDSKAQVNEPELRGNDPTITLANRQGWKEFKGFGNECRLDFRSDVDRLNRDNARKLDEVYFIHGNLYDNSLFSTSGILRSGQTYREVDPEWWLMNENTKIGYRYNLSRLKEEQKNILNCALVCKSWYEQLKPALLQLEISGFEEFEDCSQVSDSERWKNGEVPLPTIMRDMPTPVYLNVARFVFTVDDGGNVERKKQSFPPGVLFEKFSELRVNTKRSVMTHLDGEPRISVEKAVGLKKDKSEWQAERYGDLSIRAMVQGRIRFIEAFANFRSHGEELDIVVSGMFLDFGKAGTRFHWRSEKTSQNRVAKSLSAKSGFVSVHSPVTISVCLVNKDGGKTRALDSEPFYVVSSSSKKGDMEKAKAERKRKFLALTQ